jgi:methyltransferase family protein
VTSRRYRYARRIARRFGYQVVTANFYSPIPELEDVPRDLWETPDEMPGVDWGLDDQLEFVQQSLGDHLREFAPPLGYTARNPLFPPVDAELVDAVVRWSKPQRVIELGSGYSSLLIAAALPLESSHRIVDPFPSPMLAKAVRSPEVAQLSTFDAPGDWFRELQADDILFADTTHTVKVGGDVTRLILDLMPRLAPGVLVHIHDFFRPFPYPRALYEEFGVYWQEHELVQALLCENETWKILCASHALWRLRRAEVQELVPAAFDGIEPSSLWLRRR